MQTLMLLLQTSIFDGNAKHVAKFGHKANNCSNLSGSSLNTYGYASNLNNKNGNGNNNQSEKFQGKCPNCGAKGHKEVDHWQKEENKHKYPKK